MIEKLKKFFANLEKGKTKDEDLKDIIWEKINQDPKFQEIEDSLKPILRPYIEAIPEVLNELLDQTATPVNILRAQSMYLDYLAEGLFFEDLFDTVLKDQDEDFRDYMVNYLWNKFAVISLQMDQKVLTATFFEDRFGIKSDEAALEIPPLTLDPKSEKKYRKGKLSIRDLLKIQPLVLFNIPENALK